MSVYDELIKEIEKNSTEDFSKASKRLMAYVDRLKKEEISEILLDIGAIPQSIKPSSTEEKVYSKVTDIVLARCFKEVGLESEVLEARGNSADVSAKSKYHGYSLVADSKAMRLSRTAKNQKDFKVGALGDNWVGDSDTFALLCCPLYQYPAKKSQIYEQALNNKTCFFSWEHFKFLIDRNIVETDTYSLEPIWSYDARLSRTCLNNRAMNFFEKVSDNLCNRTSTNKEFFYAQISKYNKYVARRAKREKENILSNKISSIEKLSREDAINLLIKEEKKKTDTMDRLIKRLESKE